MTKALFDNSLPIVGMIHLPPLPGSPGFAGGPGTSAFSNALDGIVEHATRDAVTWIEAGADGLMVENFGDAPFFKDDVPKLTVAAMTSVIAQLRAGVESRVRPASRSGKRTGTGRIVWGVNVLRNDAAAALCIAAATGADLIRVNVLAGASVTDQGLIEGRAAEILRLRAQLFGGGADSSRGAGSRRDLRGASSGTSSGASSGVSPGVAIFADVRVKHARPLAERPVAEEVADLVGRGGADAVLVTGTRTGAPPTPEWIDEVRVVSSVPVWVASGVTAKNLESYRGRVDGIIIGSSVKPGGRIDEPVDPALAKAVVDAVAASGGSTEAKPARSTPRKSKPGKPEPGKPKPGVPKPGKSKPGKSKPGGKTLNVRVRGRRPKSVKPKAGKAAKTTPAGKAKPTGRPRSKKKARSK